MRRPAELAVTVHSLDQALVAADIAQAHGTSLHLESAPGAGGAAGLGWWLQLCRIVEARYPLLNIATVLDCADEAGTVLAAFRRGVTRVRYDGAAHVLAKLRAIAGGYGAAIEEGGIETLDLRTVHEPAAACRAWLAALGDDTITEGREASTALSEYRPARIL